MMLWRSITRRRVRTSLTVAAVALSSGAMLALLSISAGLVGQVSAIASAGGSELTVLEKSPKHFTFGYLGAMPAGVADGLRHMPDVAWVSPVLMIPGIVTRDRVFLIYGVDPSAPDVSHVPVKAGRRLTSGDRWAIMLGQRAAEGMAKNVGHQIDVFGIGLPIIGIYSSGNNLEDSGAMINLAFARLLLGREDQVSFVKVKAADPQRVRSLQQAIEARLPVVTAITSDEFARDRLSLGAAVQASWAVSIIALLLSALAVANTMAMTVLIRTREIGILRAVGWTRRRIIGLFLGEAIVLSVAGGVFGSMLGVAALQVFSARYKMLPFFSSATPALLLAGLLLPLLVGIAGGFLPAWRASRLDPVQALRYE